MPRILDLFCCAARCSTCRSSDTACSRPTGSSSSRPATTPASASCGRKASRRFAPAASVVGIYGTGGGDAKDLEMWKWAMGIDWMKTKHDLAESIPPAYAEYVGRQLLEVL